jgi:hypothetical protein
MKNSEVPPFWPHQVEVQAVRTVTQLDLWLVRTVYPADADTAAAAAERGHDWLSAFWAELTPDEREAVGGQDALAARKIIAARAG